MIEAEKGKRIDRLDEYIENQLEYFKKKADLMEEDRNRDWNKLDETFLEAISVNFL